MSSRCAANSSTACGASCAAPVRRAWARTSAFQSCGTFIVVSSPDSARLGVLDASDLPQRGDEAAPVGALLGEHPPSGLRDAVVAPPPLAGLLDPAPLDPAAILQPVERGVER